MRIAQPQDRNLVINLLAQAFKANQSVNYIIGTGEGRIHRLRFLISYSFDICRLFGEVFITEDDKGCALVLFPDKKRITIKSIVLDVRLALRAIGLMNVGRALKREVAIKKCQPEMRLYYLWFIGVRPDAQGLGIGSSLLKELKQRSQQLERTICLETSTLRNIPWYKKNGFTIYNELDFGYRLYFLKSDR